MESIARLSMSSRDAFLLHKQNGSRRISKFENYFDIYDRYIGHLKGENCTILEIGVQHGGSLQMWRALLGPSAKVIGVDINPDCLRFRDDGIDILIGDQSDPKFLSLLEQKVKSADVILDDGSHIPRHQKASFERLFFNVLRTGGYYIVEDCHTSYSKAYGGGLRKKSSFIEYSKNAIDYINHWHAGFSQLGRHPISTAVASISFYSSVVVFEKRAIPYPAQCSVGDLTLDLDAPFGEPGSMITKLKKIQYLQRAVRTSPFLWKMMKWFIKKSS